MRLTRVLALEFWLPMILRSPGPCNGDPPRVSPHPPSMGSCRGEYLRRQDRMFVIGVKEEEYQRTLRVARSGDSVGMVQALDAE